MLAELLRAARAAAKLTQAQAAVASDLTVAAYVAIEKGRAEPKLSTLRRICDALGLDLELRVAPRSPTPTPAPRRAKAA